MAETYNELSRDFTTADTIGKISIAFHESELTVRYHNWDNTPEILVFANVREFTWLDWNDMPSAVRPDEVYTVTGSELLSTWERFSVRSEPFIHFKLGFVSEGKFLDVIATNLLRLSPNQSTDPVP